MSGNQKGDQSENREEHNLSGNFGNASNPSPNKREIEQVNNKQLLDKKADKYIREAGNIEDMPDPQEQKEADRNIENGR